MLENSSCSLRRASQVSKIVMSQRSFLLSNLKFYFSILGMTGFDIKKILTRAEQSSQLSLNRWERLSVNNLVTKAKAQVSPYFGQADFAFAYANA